MKKFADILSFLIAIPGHAISTPRQKYLEAVGTYYPWVAGLCAAAVHVSIALAVFALHTLGLDDAVCILLYLTLFYVIRGIKLIDGYIDLAEGISFCVTRSKNPEDAWKVIRSPGNGAFGILWAILLIAGQFFVLKMLLGFDRYALFLIPAGMAGLSGCLGLILFHTGRNHYDPASDFVSFGEGMGKTASTVGAGIMTAGLLFAAASPFLPLTQSLQLVLAATAISILSGFGLKYLVLKTVKAFNGDVIGFVTLITELLSLLAMGILIQYGIRT